MNAIILRTGDYQRSIAGVLLLDRLVVELSRGGAESIKILGDPNQPELKRAVARGIAFEYADGVPTLTEPTLVVRDDVFIQRSDFTMLIEKGGTLQGPDKDPLPVGVLEDGSLENLKERLAGLEQHAPEGVTQTVRSQDDAKQAERLLWATMGSKCDGVVDTWLNRPVGRCLSKLLVWTSVTPNQVSAGSTILGVAAGALFYLGPYWPALWGAILLQVSAVIDCVDGDIARVAYKESELGRWLDIVGDNVVHITVFVGVGIGLWVQGNAGALPLGISAGIGALISFLVVLRGMSARHEDNARLQSFLDKMANRDFSVLLLILAAMDQLWLFLWMVGIGVHVFWVVALIILSTGGKARPE